MERGRSDQADLITPTLQNCQTYPYVPHEREKKNSPTEDSFIIFLIVSWSSRSSQATPVPLKVVHLTRKPRNRTLCDRGCVYVQERITCDPTSSLLRSGSLCLQWLLESSSCDSFLYMGPTIFIGLHCSLSAPISTSIHTAIPTKFQYIAPEFTPG